MSEEQQKLDALGAFDAYQKNVASMQQIIREMKEIAELPSEKPTDVQALTRVEFPQNGGVLTYMDGFEFPYKGFPFFEFVDRIDVIKKLLRGVLSSFYHSFKARPYWQLAGLIFVPWLFNDLVRSYLYTFHRMVERFRIKPIRHCDAMRELHRVCSIGWHNETPRERETRIMVRDILCMFLEFDNAYRFRFQDVVVELDKVKLAKNPSKEITRLFDVMTSREQQQEIRDSWKLIKFFLPWYFRLNKSLKRTVVGVLTELELPKLALSAEDKQFCEKRTDYKFGYMLCQQQNSISTKDEASSQSPSS